MPKVKKKNTRLPIIDCKECRSQADCCRGGAWIDLEEAKKILNAGIPGDIVHLEKDAIFPSGYKVGTSRDSFPCSFLGPDGLCAVHKVDYALKPNTCIEFPYEDGKLASCAWRLCTLYKSQLRNKKVKYATQGPSKPLSS